MCWAVAGARDFTEEQKPQARRELVRLHYRKQELPRIVAVATSQRDLRELASGASR